MNNSFPKVSIIIPAYKGADILPEALQSILDQTYQNFEIIVVDDASPDHTAELFNPTPDPRVKYIVQEKNLGARAARKVGIHASSGELVAFLDQDDLYHPEKLQSHVEYFREHPNVGMTYNAHFSIVDSIEFIRDICRPPRQLSLKDIVKGFPVAPSDMVLHREWARPEYMEGPWGNSGGEIVLLGRLIYDGCKLGYVDRALNYRRFHSSRIYQNLSGNCESELKCLEIIFSDPRCPADVLLERSLSPVFLYLYWGSRAFAQGQLELGRDYYSKALRLNPSIIEGSPSPLMECLFDFVLEDDTCNHRDLLQKILSSVPLEMKCVSQDYDWAVAHGHLIKGARFIMWNRPGRGRDQFEQLKGIKVVLKGSSLDRLASFLVVYDIEFGIHKTMQVLREWNTHFGNIVGKAGMKRLEAKYLIGRAFHGYNGFEYSKVRGYILRGWRNDLSYLTNRGVISIFLRSLVRAMR